MKKFATRALLYLTFVDSSIIWICMLQVFGEVQSNEMTEKFGDVLQFCSHLSKLMVTEIRRRASNQSTGMEMLSVNLLRIVINWYMYG